jgi:hypothetical protein
VNACVGEGNHLYFVLYLILMMVVMSLHTWIAVKYLMVDTNSTWGNILGTSPLIFHSVLMVVYCLALLASQYGLVCTALTTNEQFNGWRYKYMIQPSPEEIRTQGHKARFKTPFDEGKINNCLNFFRLRTPKTVVPTAEMAGLGADAGPIHGSGGASGGGEQLAPAAFGWDGVSSKEERFMASTMRACDACAINLAHLPCVFVTSLFLLPLRWSSS